MFWRVIEQYSSGFILQYRYYQPQHTLDTRSILFDASMRSGMISLHEITSTDIGCPSRWRVTRSISLSFHTSAVP